MEARMQPKILKLGGSAPDFSLPGTDGKTHGLEEFSGKELLAVVFHCNHCPYAQAYEQRFLDTQQEFDDKGLQIVLVNSNDEKNYPEDSFEKMKERAVRKKYNVPYLRDKAQEIARAYGAECTPEIFLFDRQRKLRYHGRFDENFRDAKAAKVHYFQDAVKELLMGRKVSVPLTNALGCSIKWSD